MRTHMRTMQPHAAALVVSVLAAVASPAAAKQLCRSAIFQCVGADDVTHGKNLVVLLFEERRSLKWIRKHCGEPLDRHPYRCDWRQSVRLRKLAGTAPPAPTPSLRPKAAPIPGAQARPFRAVPTPRPGRGPSPPPPRVPTITTADRGPFGAEIAAAAARYRLPADLIRAVIKIESNFNPRAVSIKGARGLMQLMPDAARAVGVDDPFDPEQCIFGGTRLLRILANRFNGDLVKVLSAFHAGSTPVKRQGGTPFASTDGYVRKVLGVYYALRDG